MVGTLRGGKMKPVQVVVIPARPPIDKYIAAKRVMLDLGTFFQIRVVFCDVNQPTPEQYDKWDKLCGEGGRQAVLIDIGDVKYHKGFQSAAEMQKLASSVKGGQTWNWLVELANENNQTGSLKQARHSVAKLVREIYHLRGNDWPVIVWEHGMDVLDSFFWLQNKRAWEELFDRSEHEPLRKLWEGFGIMETEVLPFTIPLYFRKLFMSGRSIQEIITKISWWINRALEVYQSHERARVRKYTCKSFHIHGKPAGVIGIRDYFEAAAASYQLIGSGRLALGVMRNFTTGHVHIQPSFRHPGANLEALYRELERREPTRWYHETRFRAGQMVMNGSWQFLGVTPTSLSDDELIRLVWQNVSWEGGEKRIASPRRAQSGGIKRVPKLTPPTESVADIATDARHILIGEQAQTAASAFAQVLRGVLEKEAKEDTKT